MSDHKRNLNGIEPSEMDLHYKAHPLFWVILISSLHSYLLSHCLSKNAKSSNLRFIVQQILYKLKGASDDFLLSGSNWNALA